ncbi:MAG: hypothetical protein JWO47_199 [Candidatus Saccharibacteria bacterium]|nr:hypothetical protein [Candidatus Saccharibacteria bacterium]
MKLQRISTLKLLNIAMAITWSALILEMMIKPSVLRIPDSALSRYSRYPETAGIHIAGSVLSGIFLLLVAQNIKQSYGVLKRCIQVAGLSAVLLFLLPFHEGKVIFFIHAFLSLGLFLSSSIAVIFISLRKRSPINTLLAAVASLACIVLIIAVLIKSTSWYFNAPLLELLFIACFYTSMQYNFRKNNLTL